MFRCSSASQPYLSLMNMMNNNNNSGMEKEIMKSESICTENNNNNGLTEIGAEKSPPSSSAGKKKGEKKMKKARFAFQTRSQVDILDDGYRWRKYGQKAVKNNRFPRSYYRCTHQGCNVKKQVQRLSKDEGVVVTTYEGVHSHPIEKSTDNFENILSQMQIYAAF
nr:probable WRKY transcription factor 75 [Ipomoea batatas]